jgi:propanol-preferring alcohol dehydrogenase
LIKIENQKHRPEELAPLADAALTPYRAVKKGSKDLGQSKLIAVVGIGGLGSYAVQFARILNPTSRIIAIDTNSVKLDFAIDKLGADFALDSSELGDRSSLRKQTGKSAVDLVVDCVGSNESVNRTAVPLLGKRSTLVILGLHGADSIRVPILALVSGEYKILGSSWGNYEELREVLELSPTLVHSVQVFHLEAVNEAINLLRQGKILGRAVLTSPLKS